MAIALAIAYWTITPGKQGIVKNQMIVVSAAQGKTRISMAAALCLLKKQAKTNQVVVVFSSTLLKKQDEMAWLMQRTSSSNQGQSSREW